MKSNPNQLHNYSRDTQTGLKQRSAKVDWHMKWNHSSLILTVIGNQIESQRTLLDRTCDSTGPSSKRGLSSSSMEPIVFT